MSCFKISAATILTIFGVLGSINNSLAQDSLDAGNIYISANNILLNFEGDPNLLRDATFSDRGFTIIAQSGTEFRIKSKTQNSFQITPAKYGVIACGLEESSLSVSVPENSGETIIAISPLIEKCEATITGEIQNTILNLRANPGTKKVIREVVVPLSVTVTAISAGTLVITASFGSASFAFNLTQLLQQLSIFRFYALGFLRFKRKKPWGKVIDRFSGKPLKGALVQIYEDEFKKIKDAQITDAEGRFSAVVTPGKYFLKVSRVGFESEETNLINIDGNDQIINMELAMTPYAQNFSSRYIRRVNIFNAIKKFLDTINPYLLTIGTMISLGVTIIIPGILNYAGLAIYLTLDILKIYFAIHYIKPFGRVFDAITKKAATLAVVRVFDAKNNLLLGTKVTDEDGHFNFLLSPGTYYITCSKIGFEMFRSGNLELKESGIATLDIELKHSRI